MRFIALPLVVAALALSSCELSIGSGEPESIPLPTAPETTQPPTTQAPTTTQSEYIEADDEWPYYSDLYSAADAELAWDVWESLSPADQQLTCNKWWNTDDQEFGESWEADGIPVGIIAASLDILWSEC